MLLAARTSVGALPHRAGAEDVFLDHAWADGRLHSGGGRAGLPASPGPSGEGMHAGGLRDFDGHVVVDAFRSSVRSVMSVLVAVRRLTDLDVVVMLPSTDPELARRLRERLRALDQSRYGTIGGRSVARNVYLLTGHKVPTPSFDFLLS